MIWTLADKKLFIDGRLPQYPFANHTFLEEYDEFFDKEKVAEKLSQHNIKLILIKAKEKKINLSRFEKYFLLVNEKKINNNENHLKNYLNNSSNWQLVYSDKISLIYAKNDG